FDILGNHLARLDGVVQELREVVLAPSLLVDVLGPRGRDALVEQAGSLQGLFSAGAGGLCLFRGTRGAFSPWAVSVAASPPSIPICLASSLAFSVLLNTSARSCSSLSLPSILLSSWLSSSRISMSCLSGGTCSAIPAGSKSSKCLNFNSTASLVF